MKLNEHQIRSVVRKVIYEALKGWEYPTFDPKWEEACKGFTYHNNSSENKKEVRTIAETYKRLGGQVIGYRDYMVFVKHPRVPDELALVLLPTGLPYSDAYSNIGFKVTNFKEKDPENLNDEWVGTKDKKTRMDIVSKDAGSSRPDWLNKGISTKDSDKASFNTPYKKPEYQKDMDKYRTKIIKTISPAVIKLEDVKTFNLTSNEDVVKQGEVLIHTSTKEPARNQKGSKFFQDIK